ncbi:MAG: biosynthetic-type acetolactate synthase large subunit [Lachnospiraceae bacterium]|nr:biosynthetic-type acetolactate synthase large subunit [Lachnospiraceae bacterium]
MELNGSQIVLECLLEQGVDTVFGYPGGAILNIYDALYQYQDKIHHVLTSHEQGAAHAADGYARATGKVGVCMATSGPGATNLVTGIATAYMDSIPVVAITCNVGVSLLGKDSFQEIDIAGVVMPITKHSFIVKDITKLADTIRRAFKIAQSGRPGPVLVDITKDVTGAMYEYEAVKPEPIKRKKDTITEEDLAKAVKLIKKSERPMVLVGGGAVTSGASKELAEFVELIDAPVCDTLMGKGAYDGTKENYTGMVGMHGTKTSNYAVTECDLLVAIGARFSDRVTGNAKKFAKGAKILHIDIDPAEINKNVQSDASVIGDIKEVLKELNKRIEKKSNPEWVKHIVEYKEQFPLRVPEGLSGPYVVKRLYEETKGDAVIVTEVGQHQMWAAQFYSYKKPRTLLTSGGLGTMGYGFGAAMGAKMGMPNKRVINIAGDGCFRMNINELASAARHRIPMIQVVINNHVLGMVRQWQSLFYGQRYSNTTLVDGVDFVKVAEGMGAEGMTVTTREELDIAIQKAFAAEGPFVIDCRIDSDEKVWPMVAPGAPIQEAFTDEDLDKKN